ncbi:hypothetical protein BCR43DRAFT_498509 [Syncephalastrum racemosum]|uniref:Uncharacterized protein n=1 Tax=Syncephalastrum racemosum TaxID=13706 RepID=A0A1X2H0Z3_SYNRA|nr:hypothetical protein BCR43DRAFT_498509 [Syncephalastrum racemosum]
MRFTIATLATLGLALGVQAVDYRLTYDLPSGTTVDEFCSSFSDECSTYIHENYAGQTPSSYCYAAPKDGTVNVYCNGLTVDKHTTEFAETLGLTAA